MIVRNGPRSSPLMQQEGEATACSLEAAPPAERMATQRAEPEPCTGDILHDPPAARPQLARLGGVMD